MGVGGWGRQWRFHPTLPSHFLSFRKRLFPLCFSYCKILNGKTKITLWLIISCSHVLYQSKVNLKSIVSCSCLYPFSLPWLLQHAFTSRSDCLGMFFAYVWLVRFLYEFGFGFTTLIENCSIVKWFQFLPLSVIAKIASFLPTTPAPFTLLSPLPPPPVLVV